LVVTAIALQGTTIVIIIAIARRWAAVAVTINEVAPTRRAVTARTIVVARWAVVATEFAAFVAIAWGRTIGTAETAAGPITIAVARPFHVAFNETAF
jgi:hypothetical protein